MIIELRTLSINERSKLAYHVKKGTIKTFKNSSNNVCCYSDDIEKLSNLIVSNKTIPTTYIVFDSLEYKQLKLVRLKDLDNTTYNLINNSKSLFTKGNAKRYTDENNNISINLNECIEAIKSLKKPKRTVEQKRDYYRLRQQECRERKRIALNQPTVTP